MSTWRIWARLPRISQDRAYGWASGNFDADIDVDLADLGALASNYGGSAQSFADFDALIAAVVPEPASGVALLAMAALTVRAQRKTDPHRDAEDRREEQIAVFPRFLLCALSVSVVNKVFRAATSLFPESQFRPYATVPELCGCSRPAAETPSFTAIAAAVPAAWPMITASMCSAEADPAGRGLADGEQVIDLLGSIAR